MSSVSPAPRSPLSSTPVLRTALMWGGIVTAVLLVIGAVAGFAVGGAGGLGSALSGVAVSAFFLAVTAISILVANRWYGDPLYVPDLLRDRAGRVAAEARALHRRDRRAARTGMGRSGCSTSRWW